MLEWHEEDHCKCVRCDKQLGQAVPSPKGYQPRDGVAFRSYGHWGSTEFDPMDGSWVEIALCDECFVQVPKFES